MSELLDYHVGLMRGYLLAQNAPQQIMHSLDVLLAGYQSRAGEKIGKREIKLREDHKEERPVRNRSDMFDSHEEPGEYQHRVEVTPAERKVLMQPYEHYEWSPEQEKLIRDNIDKGVVALAKMLGLDYSRVLRHVKKMRQEGLLPPKQKAG